MVWADDANRCLMSFVHKDVRNLVSNCSGSNMEDEKIVVRYLELYLVVQGLKGSKPALPAGLHRIG